MSYPPGQKRVGSPSSRGSRRRGANEGLCGMRSSAWRLRYPYDCLPGTAILLGSARHVCRDKQRRGRSCTDSPSSLVGLHTTRVRTRARGRCVKASRGIGCGHGKDPTPTPLPTDQRSYTVGIKTYHESSEVNGAVALFSIAHSARRSRSAIKTPSSSA